MGETLVLRAGLTVVLGVSVWLSIIDAREHRLPNRIVGPLAVFVTIWVLVLGTVAGDLGRAGLSLMAGFAGLVTFAVLSLVRAVGWGDTKFSYPLAVTLGWFGWTSTQVAVLATVVFAGAAALIALAQGKGATHRLPYGPFMALGFAAGVLYGLV